MKKLFLLLFTSLPFITQALPEKEQNGDFASANNIAENTAITGTVEGGGDNDYFFTVLPKDGTVKIFVKATNNDSRNGYLYMYGYDRRQAAGYLFGEYIQTSSAKGGSNISDTITLYGRAADTVYFRLISTLEFNYEFSYSMTDISPNDNEPNNNFENSLLINPKEKKQGHIGYLFNGTNDRDDYYYAILPVDGTLKIFINGINTGSGSGYLYLYGYDRRKGAGHLFGEYIEASSIKKGGKVSDTITVYGRAADTFYFRFTSSQPFSYDFSFDMADVSSTDAEPNNEFGNALSIAPQTAKTGHIGYLKNGSSDADDYYKTSLPLEGTVKIMVEGENKSGRSGYLYLYSYDKRKAGGQVSATYIAGKSSVQHGEKIYDTILIPGMQADSFFFRFTASVPFDYSIKYEMVKNSNVDDEPNDAFEEAAFIRDGSAKIGQVGYKAGSATDSYDYYYTVLPNDGTLKIYVSGKNNGTGSGYLYMYGYDRRKAAGNVFGEYLQSASVPKDASIGDTITVYGRAADTFYFRLQSSQPFSYQFSYEMTDISANDNEPNDDYETSMAIKAEEEKQGHIGYLFNGKSDAKDYYYTVLPQDGTMKILVSGTNNGTGSGYLYLYGYDRRKASGHTFGEYIQTSSAPRGTSVSDTITLYGRAADTFYFRLNATQAFNYTLSYSMTDISPNDAEPNDDYENSISIKHNEKTQGHIGYLANGKADANDYYSTLLPALGTLKIYVKGKNTSGRSGYLYAYVYDSRKASGFLQGKYIQGSSIKADSLVNDTITIYCRQTDSIYLRMNASVAFSYEFSYEIISTGANDDTEPNNEFATAISFKADDEYNGTTGYYKGGVQDSRDYYKTILPAKGDVKIFVEGHSTSGSNGSLQMIVYDKNKRQIKSRYIGGKSQIAAGETVRDTMILECLTTDTLYFAIAAGNCFTYSFNMNFETKEPAADMTHERLGNTFGFRPQLSNADEFFWTFGKPADIEAGDVGDSLMSTTPYPIKTFKPGNHKVQLIVINNACDFKDTASIDLEIKGIEYYTPDSAGVGGDLNMSFFGGGLDSNTVVSLVKDGKTVHPEQVHTNSKLDHFTAVFNIHLVEAGDYDVMVQIPGEDEIRYENGLHLEDFVYPVTSAEVLGPDRWRTNADTKFRLSVSNKGNVMASGVVVAFIWPKEVTVKFENDFIRPPKTGVVSVEVDGETFSLPRAAYSFIYDSLKTVSEIDSFNLRPYKGYVRYLLIPHVPAGSSIELPFIARSAGTGAANFITYTFKTNQRGSCDNPVYSNMNEDMTAELIDVMDMAIGETNLVPLKVLSKTAKIGQKHAGSASSYLGKKFWAWYDGYEFDGDAAMAEWLTETEANNAFALQTATDELGSLLFENASSKMLKNYQGQVDFINKRLSNNPNMSAELVDKYLDKLNSLPHDQMRRLEALKSMFKTTKDLGTLSDKMLKLQKLAEDCPELKPQIDELLKDLDKELNIRDPKDKKTNRVTSLDPNEISGPAGVGTNRYLSNTDFQHFTIFFENLDTAKASAQIVIVRDTLDKTKYDLSTFEFGNVNIGRKTMRVPKGRQQFVLDGNIEQNLPIRVRINGSLDTATGVVEWQFTSIDTTTGWLPVLEGFLPPNKNKPEGEGFVAFHVKPFENLADGTVFENRAAIIFDQNEQILTNTWVNILDKGRPASTLAARVSQDSLIHITFSGKDAVSGMGYYNLYVKTNNGEWMPFSGASTDTLTLSGKKDSTYSFYVLSLDKVGNKELKEPFAEATVTLARALAIDLGNFSAENMGTQNLLEWNTFHEDNGDYFVVERGANGSDFTTIATVKANGFASQYNYLDQTPFAGKNFYRLKLYDATGKYHYSKVVTATVTSDFLVRVYPNPVKNLIQLHIQGELHPHAVVSLTSVFGQVVFESRVTTNKMEIDVSKFARGMYILKYRYADEEHVFKVVKE